MLLDEFDRDARVAALLDDKIGAEELGRVDFILALEVGLEKLQDLFLGERRILPDRDFGHAVFVSPAAGDVNCLRASSGKGLPIFSRME